MKSTTKTKLLAFAGVALASTLVWAAVPYDIKNDILRVGSGLVGSAKELVFNVGEGASNPKISVDTTNKDFDFNADVNTTGDVNAVNVDASGTLSSGGNLVVGGNQATIGDATAVGDKVIEADIGAGVNNPKLQYNVTQNAWTFNNGTAEKKLGSGSGGGSGGTNLIENFSFEDGDSIPGWTNSGGTFTLQLYTNPAGDDLNFARFVSTVAGQYVETTAITVPSAFGPGCQAQFDKYAMATEGAFKVSVLDVSSNVLAETNLAVTQESALTDADIVRDTPVLSFQCPLAGETFRLRIEALDAGTIDFDKGYLGHNRNVVKTRTAQMAGESYFPPASACNWTTTSTSAAAFSPDADCLGPSILYSSLGQWQTTDVELPIQTINNLPAGVYKATFVAPSFSSASVRSGLSINDGATTCAGTLGESSASNGSSTVVSCVFEYSTLSNRSFQLYGAVASGTLNVFNDSTTTNTGVKFFLEYFPKADQNGVTNEQASWFIDANIGGANVATVVASDYTELTGSALDMVLRQGSAQALIPCSTTNDSTGLTCSTGNESLGVAFYPPYTGYFEACFEFSVSVVPGGQVIFQVIETPNSAQTLNQLGGSRLITGNSGSNGGVITSPSNVCGIFKFDSISKKTLRLMQEANTSSSAVIGDRSAAAGQQDIRVTVKPLLSEHNRPVLTGDEVTTEGAQNPKSFSFAYGNSVNTSCTSSPCPYLKQIGNHVVSVTRSGAGLYSANFKKTYSTIICSATFILPGSGPSTLGGSNGVFCENCSSIPFVTLNGVSGGADSIGSFKCDAEE